MQCSGCGMKIPYAGKVCPYCRRKKADDQVAHTLSFLFGAFGLLCGWLVSDYFELPFVVWFLFGPLIGIAVGMGGVWAIVKNRKSQALKVLATDRKG